MTDKELKRLSRTELLEMLLEQTKEVERLRRELEITTAQLNDRRLLLDNSGSIAEAALHLNGVFEAAQAAADQYLENITAREQEIEAHCQNIKARTEAECDALRQQAEKDAAAFWEEIRERIKNPYEEHLWWQQVVDTVDTNVGSKKPGGKS